MKSLVTLPAYSPLADPLTLEDPPAKVIVTPPTVVPLAKPFCLEFAVPVPRFTIPAGGVVPVKRETASTTHVPPHDIGPADALPIVARRAIAVRPPQGCSLIMSLPVWWTFSGQRGREA